MRESTVVKITALAPAITSAPYFWASNGVVLPQGIAERRVAMPTIRGFRPMEEEIK